MNEERNVEVFRLSDKNAEIPASGTWQFRLSNNILEEHEFMNLFLISNNSLRDAEIRINGSTSNTMPLKASDTIGLVLDDGIRFQYLDIVNLDGVNVILIDTINIRVAKVIPYREAKKLNLVS